MNTFKVYDTCKITQRNLFAIFGEIETGTISIGDTIHFTDKAFKIKGVEGVRGNHNTALIIECKDKEEMDLIKSYGWVGSSIQITNVHHEK